jgi:hypothetical protein
LEVQTDEINKSLTLSGNKTVGEAVSTEAAIIALGVGGGLDFSTESDVDCARELGMFDGGCCFFLMFSL